MARGVFGNLKRKPRKDARTFNSRTEENPLPSRIYPGRKSRNNPGCYCCMNDLVASILNYLLAGGSDMTLVSFIKEQARSWYNHYKDSEGFYTILPSR